MTLVTSGYAPANGIDMYYEVHGAGPPLVLLHGAMGTIDSCFATLLPLLAETRQVVAVELQGHGHTADVDRPLTYQQMAADTMALMGELDLQVADLIGYSMGGAVALQIALVRKVNELDRAFAGWPAEHIRALTVPALLVIGDADIVQPEHTVEMFRLLGGGVSATLPACRARSWPSCLAHHTWAYSSVSTGYTP